ncbi:hypothetical protein EDC18_102169 [Natranaerovirga pectinivora]|uniref:Uncharacterized protein n=1 Tax=Natranaerovirga pectinivora TaxID=682400 RepID=A0A4R3MMH4_9FIRM|nr:hypothetical protein [Natranaerovirga pectinivora]TCT16153.1 hypothetical protein EDC18_102169 [Natranaerovirga pectinivora]
MFKNKKLNHIAFGLLAIILVVGVTTGVKIIQGRNNELFTTENTDEIDVDILFGENDSNTEEAIDEKEEIESDILDEVTEGEKPVTSNENSNPTIIPESNNTNGNQNGNSGSPSISETITATNPNVSEPAPTTQSPSIQDAPQLYREAVVESFDDDELGKKALAYFRNKYGDHPGAKDAKAEVVNFGCHMEIYIHNDEEVFLGLAYFDGEFYEFQY